MTLFGLALAAPIEDTEEVKAARALFEEAFAKAEKGEHASLAPVQVADTPEVAATKANLQAYQNAMLVPIQSYNYAGYVK